MSACQQAGNVFGWSLKADRWRGKALGYPAKKKIREFDLRAMELTVQFAEKLKVRGTEEVSRLRQHLVEMKLLPGSKSYTRFVILSDIRSGSTMLVNYLNSHQNVRVFFEPFHMFPESIPFSVAGYASRGRSKQNAALRNADPVGFMNAQIFNRMPKEIDAVGFKLLHTQARKFPAWFDGPEYSDWWSHVDASSRLRWRHANSDLWAALKSDRELKLILLRRDNPLEALVSAELAKVTGKWGIGATGGLEDSQQQTQVVLKTQHMLRDFQAGKRYREDALEFFSEHDVIETSYETIVNDPQSELNRLQMFLNLNPSKLTTKTVKQQKSPLADRVQNWSEVSTYLTANGMSHLLM